jgi:hypothetical protein
MELTQVLAKAKDALKQYNEAILCVKRQVFAKAREIRAADSQKNGFTNNPHNQVIWKNSSGNPRIERSRYNDCCQLVNVHGSFHIGHFQTTEELGAIVSFAQLTSRVNVVDDTYETDRSIAEALASFERARIHLVQIGKALAKEIILNDGLGLTLPYGATVNRLDQSLRLNTGQDRAALIGLGWGSEWGGTDDDRAQALFLQGLLIYN